MWRRYYSEIIDMKKISELIPSEYSLEQNYPNPFNLSTIIRFKIPGSENGKLKTENSRVVLKVYDILGKEIKTLVNEKLSPGEYKVPFAINQIPSGIYFYRLQMDGYSETKKMMLIK